MPEVKAYPKLDPPQTCEPNRVEIADAVPAGRGVSESESQIEY